MSLPFFISRHLSLRSSGQSGSTGILVAVTGVSLSVIVMIISISVMMGFRHEIRQKVIGFDSQISIGVRPVVTSDTVTDIASQTLISRRDLLPVYDVLPRDAKVNFSVRQPAILKTPDNFSGSVIKGVDADYDWSFIRGNLVEGVVPDFNSDSTMYHIVVSRTLSRTLGLELGDKLDAYFLGNDTYRARRLKISGIYDTHFSEYDRNMVFGSLGMLQQVAGVPDSCATLVEINGLPDDDAIDATASAIANTYIEQLYTGKSDRHYAVVNIHDSAAIFFNWLLLLDTNVSVILTLMSLLTALTLVSSLFILILRRVNMIGILKALGASNRMIRYTFVILATRLLIVGLLVGNVIGVGLLYVQRATGLVPLDPDAYYLDHVPVMIDWGTIAILNISIIAVSFLVLLIPSAIVTTIPPSRAINYE